jgi:hypothetical protein
MNLFFEKINNIDKTLAKPTKWKRKETILINLDLKEDITIYTRGIQRITKKYFKNLYSNKLKT